MNQDKLLDNPKVIAAAVEEAKANAEKARAEAEEAKANAAQAKAETRRVKAQAGTSEISLDREREKRERELASNYYHKVYLFNDIVGSTSTDKCMAVLSEWSRLWPKCPITIVFNSPGGDVVAGMALFDFIQDIRRRGHQVTTRALGYAASMAGILLQAGEMRIMGAESWLLIHEGSFGVSGDFGDVVDRVEWVKRIHERILDIFTARSNLSKAQIKHRWHRKDWWLSSDEALKFGFCDAVE